jgi:LuxR family maltose regulon positive regulatory protein
MRGVAVTTTTDMIAGASERRGSVADDLLATKLHMPSQQPGLTARGRLQELLDNGLNSDLTCVVAPAGYGKSVALTEWCRLADLSISWLSLDSGDNDPVRFWRHILAALDRARPGLMAELEALAGPPAPRSFDGLVAALVNTMTSEPAGPDVVLVLDDYHVVSSETVDASLRFLLEHRPAALHLLIASRADPPLGLARLRGRGRLTEVRAADLRFTVDEAAGLIRQVGAPELDRALVQALAERTEGWAVGLQLAALSLRDEHDVPRFVGAFTGSHRHVLDYLTEEVLERQNDQVREFLLETSVLERLSAPVCDAVTNRSDSQQMLQWLDQSGLFVVQLDDVRGWWRYHHLFADLLRARLGRSSQRTRELHRRAAAWYEQQQLFDDTIHHAAAAGDMLWAARLIEAQFDNAFNLRGEQTSILAWLSLLPAELISERPRLLLAKAQMPIMHGDLVTVEPLLEQIEQALLSWEDEPLEPNAGVAGSLLVNPRAMLALQRAYAAQWRGDADNTAAFTKLAQDHLRDGELVLDSAVQGFFAVADWLHGDLEKAERNFASQLDESRTREQITSTAWAEYSLARLQRARGRLRAAKRTCERALAATTTPDGQPLPAAGAALVGLALVAYQRDELPLAWEHGSLGVALCRQFVHTPPLAAGLSVLARIHHLRGDEDATSAAMDEADSVSLGPPGLLNPVPVLRAQLLLAQGRVDEVERWTRQCQLSPDDPPAYPREAAHLVLCRVFIAQNKPEAVLPLLDRLGAVAERQRRNGDLMEIRAVRAAALHVRGDREAAAQCLRSALAIGVRGGYVRLFADIGPVIGELLPLVVARGRRDADNSIPLGYLSALDRALGRAPSRDEFYPRGPRYAAGLVEQLTAREREVLGMLSGGRSNRDIAAELVVSLDTVKKHVSHVLAKLGATNRTEAVARGRELDLVG